MVKSSSILLSPSFISTIIFFQPFTPIATSSLLPLANKHVQIFSTLKKYVFLAQALPLTMCSLYSSLFGCFWRILCSNDLYIFASYSCFLSTMKSWFSPPMYHTLASTLQNLFWKWQPMISIMSNLSILYSYFLVLSVLFENSRDSVLSKIVYPRFPWYYSLLGLTLFCYYLPYEYICFSSACSLNASVPQGFFVSSFFLYTAFLSICSFQVPSFELMI